MRAGQLRHRVLLQYPTDVAPNAYGESQGVTWTTIDSGTPGNGFWAAIEPLSGSETQDAKQMEGRVTHQIRMRHISGLNIKPTWRVVYNARVFNITQVVPDEVFRETRLICTEVV